jgi:flagellar hook-length control protein FliK
MPQPIAIQTEILPSVSASKVTSPGQSTDREGFSEAFSAHLNKDQGVSTSTKAKQGQIAEPSEKAAKTDEEAEVLAASDNESKEEVSEAVVSEENDQEVVSEEVALVDESLETSVEVELVIDETTDAIETDTETDVETIIEQTVATEDESDSVDSVADEVVSNEPVTDARATVTVSQNAVDHAKTEQVVMTAKETVEQPEETNVAPIQTTPKAEKITQASNAASTKASEVLTSKSLVSNARPLASTGLTLEKSTEASSSTKPENAIRADLLDALNRQTNKDMTTAKVRDAVLQTTQESVTKSEVQTALLSEKVLPERAATTSLNSATTLAATTVGSASPSAPPTTASQSTVVSLPIQPQINQSAWSKVMSSRVIWMAKEGIQQAELRMTPAHLGPVEVRLHVQNEQASVVFLAQHAATRDALEQALPRLREGFAESGLELANAHVGEQAEHQQETDHSQETHIFSQGIQQPDDNEIMEELENTGELKSGISLYA